MADKSLGLGKLLAKSKSTIRRRPRKGSVDGSNSLESGDATSSVSFSHQSNSDSHSRSELDHDRLEGHGNNEAASVVVPGLAHQESEESTTSLVSTTNDSEDQELLGSSSRPIASNHPSQIGYLTTNSPLIQHQYYHDTSTTDSKGELEAYPAGLAPPTSRSSRRAPSPVGRIKNAFRSKKSLQKLSGGSSQSSSPERRPTSSDSRRSQPSSDLQDAFSTAHSPTAELPPRALPEKEAGPGWDTGAEGTQELKRVPTERGSRLPRGRAQSIEIRTPPGSPPTAPDKGTPPVIVNTPPTPTNTTSPRFSLIRNASPAEGGQIAQRRGRADSASIVPSKLSTILSAPLTPIESVAATPTNQASGFFGSVISAAQNAAQNFSNTISNSNVGTGSQKNRSLSSGQTLQKGLDEEHNVEVESSAAANPGAFMESQEPAVKTIGTGDLSLSHLGIETMDRATTPTTSRFPDHPEQGRTRSDSAPIEASPLQNAVELPWDDTHRPHSLYDSQGFGDKTPPTGSVYDEGAGVHRSGSIRSAIGGARNRTARKRGSTGGTGGTGNTIGAALSAVNTSLAQPGAQIGAPKLTGFAVASKRRNRDFHDLFKSVPDDDYLIEDYSCALQREILAHGRLYVSEGHLCFSSNILGWVTTLVMSFDEIVSVEKRSTALLFKNGLMISTLHAKHIFASFTSRDSTYDLIVKIWKLGHPGLQSSLNGVRLDETGGDKTEKIDGEGMADGEHSHSASASDEEDASEDGDDVYDEDEEEDEDFEPAQATEAPLLQSSAIEKSVTRKPSGAVGSAIAAVEKAKDVLVAPAGGQDFPGPATHAATDCGDADAHYKRVTGDDVVPAPLGKVYDMLFGPNSAAWMSNFLTKDQKCLDLQMEDKSGLTDDHKTRAYTYIKPLSGAIGPKQTKCIISENLEVLDLEHVVRVLVTTQNPDVPSGNVFNVKTKYCLTWAENNSTRVQINCFVEWTGKSWLKGPIENGANEGQSQFCKDLFTAMKAAVSKRSAAGAGGKGRKKGKKGKTSQTANVTSDSDEPSKASAKHNWGMLEPLHDIIGPVLDIGKPLMTGNLLYGLLVGLLVTAWFGFGRNSRPVAAPYGSGLGLYGYPDRLAAYEEMWRREESELWEWLEERVGMERLSNGGPASHPRQKVVEPRTMEEKLREDRMDEKEVKEAIRITEEKLRVLKSVVGVDD